jgi:hypothetical protein
VVITGNTLATYLLEKRIIAPGGIGHDVMQRLVHLAYVAWSQARSHRLDALALDRQQEPLGVVLDGTYPIGMSGYLGQTVKIGLQTIMLAREIQAAITHRPQGNQSPLPAPGNSK